MRCRPVLLNEGIFVPAHYQEPFRNQFHFSPRTGWMNDINGVWFDEGIYHLTYQAYPYATHWDTMHWGHAVSRDLLHWTQKEPVLTPGDNTVGMAYSGSAVIDRDNTAGFGEGACLLFYTDILRGQCLAYSTDHGETFRDYESNPVVLLPALSNNGADKSWQRDPKVFWDGETARWYMVVFREKDPIYDHVDQFYASSDLLHWERIVDFVGDKFWECPDMYSLPLDGDPTNRYWILQSGTTHYYIGRFDGKRFLPVEFPDEYLDYGPDFYAGQTFSNMPDERTIAMYWLDRWNGSTVSTDPWIHAATIPCELKLITTSEGMRVTRYPIEEIQSLWENSRQWTDIVTASHNPLEGIHAVTYDLAIDFEMEESEASILLLVFRGKEYQISLSEETLTANFIRPDNAENQTLTVPCQGISRKLSMRILGDRDCVEIFLNGGRYNYTEEYGFDPDNATLSVSTDSPLPCTIRYAEVKSCWLEE